MLLATIARSATWRLERVSCELAAVLLFGGKVLAAVIKQ